MNTPHTLLGVDIGGTFTDFVLLRDGRITVHKHPTTPDNPSRALLAGVVVLGLPDTLIHGTTIATNALLERRGAVTALLTTAGFADVLVIGRGIRSALYDLHPQPAPPIVPAHLRREVAERIAADGSILQPLDEAALRETIEQLAASEVESVAVCFLHSYRNPAHEQRAADLLYATQREDGTPRFFVCASCDVIPEYREYERTSTTVVNAYVSPVLDRYLGTIERELEQHTTAQGHAPQVYIMSSDGGSMTARGARRLGARTTLSGPAGGVVGARAVAQQAGFERIISFDMGGTSTDVALCDGKLPQTTESSVGGCPVRFPSIAIHTVGAGGGSLARMDAGGALRVGPQSAGAAPGPACYGRGTLPTVTDANLLLGRLRADDFLGGDMVLDRARAEAAIATLAHELALDTAATALGIVQIANAAMERAIRTISVERGIDPRDFTLVGFGGAGPLHAAYLAEALGMARVLLPRYPGVLSALGMLTADITRDYVDALATPLQSLSPTTLLAHMTALAQQATRDMAHDKGGGTMTAPDVQAQFTLDLRYVGQSHEIATPLMVWEAMAPAAPDLEPAAQRFHQLHAQQSGHALPHHPIEAVALRLKAVRVRERMRWEGEDHGAEAVAPTPPVIVSAALSAETTQPVGTAIYRRETLRPGDTLTAPAIVVQFDSTCVIPPGWSAQVDAHGNLLLHHATAQGGGLRA